MGWIVLWLCGFFCLFVVLGVFVVVHEMCALFDVLQSF